MKANLCILRQVRKLSKSCFSISPFTSSLNSIISLSFLSSFFFILFPFFGLAGFIFVFGFNLDDFEVVINFIPF